MEQRTIKFKSKCLDDSEWVEGYYIKKPSYHQTPKGDVVEDGEEHLIFGMTKDDVQPLCYEVDPSTVCQFTGLKDREGVDIYEHDILIDGTLAYKVGFVNCGFAASFKDEDDFYLNLLALNRSCRVYGNEFDRKEEK